MYVDFKKQSFKKLLVFCVVKSVRFKKKLYQKLFSIFNKKNIYTCTLDKNIYLVQLDYHFTM